VCACSVHTYKDERKVGTVSFAKTQNGTEKLRFQSVDDFVAAKAPNLYSFQSTSTSVPQTIQCQSLRISEKSIDFNKAWNLVRDQEVGDSSLLMPRLSWRILSRLAVLM
jgi:hypothetical protein